MFSLLTSSFRKPSLPHLVLLGLVVMACSVDSSRAIPKIAGVSVLGGMSLASGGAVWATWLLRPQLPRTLLGVFLPLMMLGLDAVGTLMWYRPHAMDGVQLLTVSVTFLGTMMLTARETAADPVFAQQLRSTLLLTSAIPVLAWAGLLMTGIVRKEDANITRPFALYTLTMVSVALSTWRGYAWPEARKGEFVSRRVSGWKSFRPLIWVGFTAFVVLLGMSRTALIAIAVMIPLSLIYRGSVKSLTAGFLILAIGAGVLGVGVATYPPLHDRFFGEDAHMQVGGVAINGSGRTRIWGLLLNTIGDDWVFGKGISASEDIINQMMNNIGQPHNDYLRIYYDQGVMGLGLWFSFVAGFVYRTIGNLRRSIRNRSPDYPMHLAALLALTGVAISMATDNSYCYAFVMFPLAIVMGSSLGVGRHFQEIELASMPEPEPVYFQAMTAMPSLRRTH